MNDEPVDNEAVAKDEDLEFDEQALSVDISDTTLEEDDKKKDLAKRDAKKIAKKLRTPHEQKISTRKKLIAAGIFIVVLIVALLAIPKTRWPILNFVGFRGNLQVTLLEKTTNHPISNATVQLDATNQNITDASGKTTFKQMKLGSHKVLAQKSGYGDVTTTVVNSLGTTKPKITMKVIGIKLDFDLKNWLSEQPIGGAKVSFNKSIAQSDQTGRASLVIPPTDQTQISVEITAPGYLTKTVKTELAVESREISLVSAEKNYFISKRDGKYDIFSSNLDGSSQQKLIEATGKEDDSLLQFTINRNNKQAILVATRDGKIQNGRLIAGIYSVDLEHSTLKKIDEGSDVRLLDWADNAIVYTKADPSVNYDDPNVSHLMSFNTSSGKLSEISQTNYFAVAILAQGKVFYMPSDPYRSIDNAVLTSQDIASGAKKTYLDGKQLTYGTRSGYNTLALQDNNGGNYELKVGTGTTKASDTRPGTTFNFALNAGGTMAAWSDQRDGQGALLTHNLKSGEEKVVAKSGGLTNPVRYINDDLVVVRVATSQETADYVVSLSTGKLGKIVDVSDIGTVR